MDPCNYCNKYHPEHQVCGPYIDSLNEEEVIEAAPAEARVRELEAEVERLRESKKFMLENQAKIYNKTLTEYGERIAELEAALEVALDHVKWDRVSACESSLTKALTEDDKNE